MAMAASLVFLKWTRRSDPLALQDLAGLSGALEYADLTIVGVGGVVVLAELLKLKHTTCAHKLAGQRRALSTFSVC